MSEIVCLIEIAKQYIIIKKVDLTTIMLLNPQKKNENEPRDTTRFVDSK